MKTETFLEAQATGIDGQQVNIVVEGATADGNGGYAWRFYDDGRLRV